MKSTLYAVAALFSLIAGSLLFTATPAEDADALWVLIPGYLLITAGVGLAYIGLTCNHGASRSRR